ncbi:FUSC family protein [Enterovirga sp. CN4-39]|uniref:FUSC family protein n=1 Tax=Enterovirga sp. CN4-39 TaxID=3400910 RepID=UPI003BFD7FC1
MTALTAASRLGFDPERLRFGLRTAAGACIALLAAYLLGLEHPQWAAMTVWAAAQPVRGMLLEKGLFRAAGTLVGIVFGILLMVLSGGSPIVIVLGLSIWIGLCAAAGNVLRGFLSYGAILAGYSASMVLLLDTGHPDRILALGLDRFLTVMVGVAVGTLTAFLLTPKGAEDAIVGRMRRVDARVLLHLAARLGAPGQGREDETLLLGELAAIEEGLDPHAAGSMRSRRAARVFRAILMAQVRALLWARATRGEPSPHPAAACLIQAAHALEAARPLAEVVPAIEEGAAKLADQPELKEALGQLARAMRTRLAGDEAEQRPEPLAQWAVLHRDWRGAREAMIRATAVMLLVGAFWLVTGSSAGPFVLLGTSVMISVFSTFENPAHVMRFVFLGQVVGALAALACRWVVWPLATGETQLVLMMVPFVLSGILPFAHRRTIAAGTDYNMILLLLLQPHYPLTGDFAHSVGIALGVVVAPLIALAAFRFVFPVDAGRRMHMIAETIVRELENMARSPRPDASPVVWRARLEHRLLRLLRWGERSGTDPAPLVDAGLAALRLGEAVRIMRRLAGEPGMTAGIQRTAGIALQRIAQLESEPGRAARAMDRLAARLAPLRPGEAARVADAAGRLPAASALLRHAPRPRREP